MKSSSNYFTCPKCNRTSLVYVGSVGNHDCFRCSNCESEFSWIRNEPEEYDEWEDDEEHRHPDDYERW